jgi:hypothetical protein
MKKKFILTAKDVENVTVDDLFFAMFTRKPMNISVDESQEYLKQNPDEAVELKEHAGTLAKETLNNLDSDAEKELATFIAPIMNLFAEPFQAAVVLKLGDKYIKVNGDIEQIDLNKWSISDIESFANFYKENEFRFLEAENGVSLDVDFTEPFEEYEVRQTNKRNTEDTVVFTKKR